MNKQALTEALVDYNLRDVTPVAVPHLNPIIAAARLVERLLPGECEHGETTEHGAFRPGVPGSSWMCPGRVWDEGIVEAVTDAIVAEYRKGRGDTRVKEMARAVLSALVELLTEKVEE